MGKIKRIYLMGFMGCGKSTLGKLLAKKLGWNFTDLDHLIEQSTGKPVSTLFSEHGERYFREQERLQLHETDRLANYVIATGGGTSCFYDNLDWMNENGTTIYIKVPSTDLLSRLKQGKTQRPLIQTMNDKDLADFIQKLMQEREPIYTCCSYVFNVGQGESSLDSLERLQLMLKSV